MLIRKPTTAPKIAVKRHAPTNILGQQAEPVWGAFFEGATHPHATFKTRAEADAYLERTKAAYGALTGAAEAGADQGEDQGASEAKGQELSDDEREHGRYVERDGVKVRITNRNQLLNISESAAFISKYGRDAYLGLPYR